MLYFNNFIFIIYIILILYLLYITFTLDLHIGQKVSAGVFTQSIFDPFHIYFDQKNSIMIFIFVFSLTQEYRWVFLLNYT